MGTDMEPNPEEELITVQEFARRYRVDASVVRWWVKKGFVDYVLVGPRKLRRIRPGDLVRTAHEPGDPVNVQGNTGFFDQGNRENGGDNGTTPVSSSNGGSSGISQRNTTNQQAGDHSPRSGSAGKGTADHRADRGKAGRVR